jgi:hypothetical protein
LCNEEDISLFLVDKVEREIVVSQIRGDVCHLQYTPANDVDVRKVRTGRRQMEFNFIARQQFNVHANRDWRSILANQSLHGFSTQIGVRGAGVHDEEEDIAKGKGRPGTDWAITTTLSATRQVDHEAMIHSGSFPKSRGSCVKKHT